MAQQRRKNKSAKSQKPKPATERQIPPSVVVSEPLLATNHENSSSQDKEDRKRKTKWWAPLKKLKTWERLAVIGGVVILIYQSAQLNKTNVLSESATKESDANSQLDQRAFLFADFSLEREPKGVIKSPQGQEVVDNARLIFPITNTGKTPALRVRAVWSIRYLKEPPPEPDWNDLVAGQKFLDDHIANGWKRDPATLTRLFTIFPGSRQRFFSDISAGGGAFFDDYRMRRTHMTVWLRLDYCDIFGMPHWTKVCSIHSHPDERNARANDFPYCLGGGLVTDDDTDQRSDYACQQTKGQP